VRQSRVVLIGLIALALVQAGCGGENRSAPLGPFRQSDVEKCFDAKRISRISVIRRDISPLLLRRFPGITGSMAIVRGPEKSSPGVNLGPPIDGGTLVFEKTATEARHDQAGVYDVLHDFRVSPLDPPAPAFAIPSLHSTRGNVIVLWDYPVRHRALSVGIVDDCMPAG
jgi:hypothetical protein